ncbi:trypsin-like cysteine/serine peptidase domain-containing protein [Glomus cerebriforme]|uniref:Trypsin-like cysteine/serine peptidase domain-containing protein n=1 Tax=Glomus cerebriforme TaxID=658196 RepID=A0A397TW18_9GLOM|nr:trypsin-like cysteine/serine peptidase domain-containing protein [Glomus cerebriforme]
MIDESEDLKQDLKPNPQAIKVAAAYEQIAPPNVNERTFRNRSKSVSYSSRQNAHLLNYPVKVHSWEPTLEKAIKAIVSIKANHVRSFDTETSGAYSATGFVVDRERGIILSNRHVVSPAPIVAQAIFTNYEEVELHPIYRDPVHDFGFMKFDPTKIKFMDLVQIPLSPEKAKVGLEIRVVGNDAGEKLSILAGTLARLDRRAPEYGIGEYNDFNTFYLQAASGTSGGSSGSPVLDIEGNAVALNAGGASSASSSYYLPLDRVKRALRYLQKGMKVPRGTLQTEFEYLPYDELRRLGLKSSIEQEIREKFPDDTGLLVVRTVLPKGPADGLLVPGDIIICANKKMITNFTHLFSIIDDSIGEDIELTICRGKVQMDVKIKIQDLHSITPNRFVEVGGGIVNELSYQLAHSYSQPVGGPFVATSGHMLASASAWRKSVIVSVNNIPTPNLDAFIDAMKTLPDGARVPLRFYSLSKVYKEKVMIMHVDRHWHKFQVAVRDDMTGLWNYEVMPPPPAIHSYEPATAHIQILDESLHPAGKIWPSFVALDFHLPYLVDGMKSTQFYGAGVVLSTEPPLIICDRDTIPINVGDIFITFANSIIIPGKLLYLHPMYNYAILTYEKRLLGETPVKAIELSDKELVQGDPVYLVGIGGDHSPVMKKTNVTSIGNVGTKECSPPRWRAMNVEGIRVDDPVGSQGGVLCDADGKVQGLWLNYSSQNEKNKDITFMSGLPISLVKPVLEPLKRGEFPKLRGLDVEFWTMRIAAARALGLSDEWVRKVESAPNSKHTLLYILNILDSTSSAGKLLEVGDLVLMMNGRMVTRMSDLPAAFHYSEEVEMVILRDGKEKKVKVETSPYHGKETSRIIGWSGALVQAPYRAVLEQVRNIPTGVYVSCTLYGSPASVSLRPGIWIVEVQGRKVSDLDSFLEAVHAHEKEMKEKSEDSSEYIRIKTISRTEVTKVVAMKLDPHYWSTWQLIEDDNAITGWKCVEA